MSPNRERGAAVCVLAAFYFIPVGSLPPYIAFEWGGFAAAALLALSAGLNLPRGALSSGAAVKEFFFPTVFCFAWVLLALFVSCAGTPGALCSLETYSVMPLWNAAGMWGRAGMALLLILLLCALPDVSLRSGETPAAPLYSSLCAALVTALMLPWNLSEFVEIGGVFAFLLDFMFFWAKVFVVGRAAPRVSQCAGGLAVRRMPVLCAALMLCSALCFFIEAGVF